jgi:hypothetical protein
MEERGRGVQARVVHGWAVGVAGPTAAGAGGYRRRATREGEREGGGRVAAMWPGSGVWSPAAGREREK